jgi:hypothetical protein
MADSTVGERVAKSLGDYVQVKDRIAKFYELFGGGRLVTDRVEIWMEDGTPRVVVKALAYRTVDDPHPGVGWSWMELPGRTPYTKGSEVENAETSAWGRAIGSLGILIDASIATQNEIDNKADDRSGDLDNDKNGERGDIEAMIGRVRRRGIIRKGSAEDYKLVARQGPDGHVFGFRLEIDGDKNIPQCIVSGPLGEAAYLAVSMKPETLVGKVATVAGILYNVKRPDKPGSWYRLHVDLIETEEWILPAPVEEKLPEPPSDVALVGEHEAATAPLFDE